MGLTYLLELNEETYEGLVFFNDWNTFVLVVKVELLFWYPSITLLRRSEERRVV